MVQEVRGGRGELEDREVLVVQEALEGALQADREEAPLVVQEGGRGLSKRGEEASRNLPVEAPCASSVVVLLASSEGALVACWGAAGALGSAACVEVAGLGGAVEASYQALPQEGHLVGHQPGYLLGENKKQLLQI